VRASRPECDRAPAASARGFHRGRPLTGYRSIVAPAAATTMRTGPKVRVEWSYTEKLWIHDLTQDATYPPC
jgi:hypothetical protein